MTIAVCSVSPEGVVFGADSTTSFMVSDGFHYLNHNQKIFEIGNGSTLAAMTWGMASLGEMSHRTQFALLADTLTSQGVKDVRRTCEIWINQFWPLYQNAVAAQLPTLVALHQKPPFMKAVTISQGARTEDEERTYQRLRLGLLVGFCIGGYDPADRAPAAFEIIFDPLAAKPNPTAVAIGDTRCWGAPKVFGRIVSGIDPEARLAILSSGNWSGTPQDLDTLLASHQLYLPGLPIRDALDFVHSCISSTIKTLKFSHLSQVCGGPIEIAVITTDRDFRWVRHKEWDVAIKEGHTQWRI